MFNSSIYCSGAITTPQIYYGTTGTLLIGSTAVNTTNSYIPVSILGPTGRGIGFGMNISSGLYNDIVTQGDNLIYFTDKAGSTYNQSSGLSICPNAGVASGIRITNQGVAINTRYDAQGMTGATGAFFVTGDITQTNINGGPNIKLSGGVISGANLAGGSTGSLIYQSQTNGTTFLPIGPIGQFLMSDGNNLTWSAANAGIATSVQVDGTTTPTTWYPTFVGGTGNATSNPQTPNISQNGLQFVPSTGNLSAISYSNISDSSFKQGIYDLNDLSSILHTGEPTASDVVYDVDGDGKYEIVNDGGESGDDGLTSTNGKQDIHTFPTDGSEDYAKVQYRVDELFPKIYQIKCPDGKYKTQIGFLADDIEGTDLRFLVGDASIDYEDGTKKQIKTLNYIGLIGLLTQEIKELKTSMQLLLQSMPGIPANFIKSLTVSGVLVYTPITTSIAASTSS
jgi:hypothetical protein